MIFIRVHNSGSVSHAREVSAEGSSKKSESLVLKQLSSKDGQVLLQAWAGEVWLERRGYAWEGHYYRLSLITLKFTPQAQ